jgi:hypothetical protein
MGGEPVGKVRNWYRLGVEVVTLLCWRAWSRVGLILVEPVAIFGDRPLGILGLFAISQRADAVEDRL